LSRGGTRWRSRAAPGSSSRSTRWCRPEVRGSGPRARAGLARISYRGRSPPRHEERGNQAGKSPDGGPRCGRTCEPGPETVRELERSVCERDRKQTPSEG
jgi:hypothetical protein